MPENSSNQLKMAIGSQKLLKTVPNGSKWLKIGSGSADQFDDEGFLELENWSNALKLALDWQKKLKPVNSADGQK